MEPQGRAQQETIPKNPTPRSHRRQKNGILRPKIPSSTQSGAFGMPSGEEDLGRALLWEIPIRARRFSPPDLFLNRGPVTAGAGGGLDRGGDLGSDLGCYL